jgi:hypothetical protein
MPTQTDLFAKMLVAIPRLVPIDDRTANPRRANRSTAGIGPKRRTNGCDNPHKDAHNELYHSFFPSHTGRDFLRNPYRSGKIALEIVINPKFQIMMILDRSPPRACPSRIGAKNRSRFIRMPL